MYFLSVTVILCHFPPLSLISPKTPPSASFQAVCVSVHSLSLVSSPNTTPLSRNSWCQKRITGPRKVHFFFSPSLSHELPVELICPGHTSCYLVSRCSTSFLNSHWCMSFFLSFFFFVCAHFHQISRHFGSDIKSSRVRKVR